MKIKTSDLTLLALDWAVAECEFVGTPPIKEVSGVLYTVEGDYWNPSTVWAQGGPIIEREGIAIDVVRAGWTIDSWVAALVHEDKEFDGVARAEEYGPTPLIAAMRCYVASKLGDEVDIPEGLQ